MYIPDNWVKIHVKSDKFEADKIVAGWSGNYIDSDNWRINSGITQEKRGEDDQGHKYIDYIGHSGSVYRCYLDRLGIANSFLDVLDELLQPRSDGLEVSLVDVEEIV